MVLSSVFWKIWSLWKPVTAVFSMHFFNYFAVWLSHYSYEEVMAAIKLIVNDSWTRQFFPYSLNWLLNNSWNEAVSWFSWVGYRFRQEAQLWWMVIKYDQEFANQQLAYGNMVDNPDDPDARRLFEDIMIRSYYSSPRPPRPVLDLDWDLPEDRRPGLHITEYGYSQTPVDTTTAPERPKEEPRIRFQNQRRAYPEGKPHYYYADPQEYTSTSQPGPLNRGQIDYQNDLSDLTDDDFQDYNDEDQDSRTELISKGYKRPPLRQFRKINPQSKTYKQELLMRREKDKLREMYDNDQYSDLEQTPKKSIWREDRDKNPLPYRFHPLDADAVKEGYYD